MIEIDKIAENLFDKIRSRFDNINIGDENAKATLDPIKARFFNFDYNVDGEEYGNVTLSIVDSTSLKVYFDKEIDHGMDEDHRDEWYDFLRGIRKFAKRNLMSFDIRDIAKSGLNLRDLKHANKDAEVFDKDDVNLAESKLYGTSRSSYQQLENVRIVARHSKRIVDDSIPGARSRNIECFYVENSMGERFRLPEGTTLNGARAYARHFKNGGQIHDDFYKHINKIITEMNSLKLFVRNMRGRQFEDAETTQMVEAAIDHYGSLHRDLFDLRGQRGYEQYKAIWQPEQPLTDDFDMNALKERFVRKVFDERLMDALPIVQRVYQERKNKVGEEFEAWANGIVSEDEAEDNPENNYITNPADNSGEVDIDGNTMDGESTQEVYDHLLDHNDFEYTYNEGTYWFDSSGEIERAKDIIAAYDPNLDFPKMGVRKPDGQEYGASTFDRKFADHGVMEDAVWLKRLAGLTK